MNSFLLLFDLRHHPNIAPPDTKLNKKLGNFNQCAFESHLEIFIHSAYSQLVFMPAFDIIIDYMRFYLLKNDHYITRVLKQKSDVFFIAHQTRRRGNYSIDL